jgi:DNA polymerase III epsilon subunit-like protein
MSPRTIALSCETSDALDPEGHLIELCAMPIPNYASHTGCPPAQQGGAAFHALIQSPAPIPPAATAAHGHTQASLAAAGGAWVDIAPLFLAHVRHAQLLVWHAEFHIHHIDRALARAGHAPLRTHVADIIDLRQVLRTHPLSPPPRLSDLLTQHALHSPQPANALQQAQQLAHLWLALACPTGGAGQ